MPESTASQPRKSGSQLSNRRALKAPVVRYDDASVKWTSMDVSEGGAFLAGPSLPAVGTEMDLGLWLPDDDTSMEIVTRGRVAWVNDIHALKKQTLPQGVGVQFVDMDTEDRNLLREYLKQYGPTEIVKTNLHVMIQEELDVEASSSAQAGDANIAEEEDLSDDAVALGTEIGPYRIIELLGSGGMGDVFLAEHVQLGRRVALKRLAPRFTRNPGVVRRFFDEARVVNQIRHPNLIEITDFISEAKNHYYVMELLDGVNLAQLYDRDGTLPLHRVLNISIQLCDALDAVHRAGVVHRDLKPANVMLVQRDGHRDFVKLLDFGVAKLRDPMNGHSINATSDGMPLGTPGYMAPEQLLDGRVDQRSDIYAVGVLLYQMVTGRKPFVASTWGELLLKHAHEPPSKLTAEEARDVPKMLQALIMRCLEKDPEKRPQSAAAVAVALRRILATTPITETSWPASSPDQSKFVAELQLMTRPRWHFPALIAGGVAALICGVLVAAQITSTPSEQSNAGQDPQLSGEASGATTADGQSGLKGWSVVVLPAHTDGSSRKERRHRAAPETRAAPVSEPVPQKKSAKRKTSVSRRRSRRAKTSVKSVQKKAPKEKDGFGSFFDQFED